MFRPIALDKANQVERLESATEMLLSSNLVYKYPTISKIKCFNNNDKLMSWKGAVEKKFSQKNTHK